MKKVLIAKVKNYQYLLSLEGSISYEEFFIQRNGGNNRPLLRKLVKKIECSHEQMWETSTKQGYWPYPLESRYAKNMKVIHPEGKAFYKIAATDNPLAELQYLIFFRIPYLGGWPDGIYEINISKLDWWILNIKLKIQKFKSPLNFKVCLQK